MNRGRRLHHNTQLLFADEPVQVPQFVIKKYGRNARLVYERNRKLVHRYYFKSQILRMRHFEDISEELTEEFNLCNKRICHILFTEHYDLVKEIIQLKLTTKDLINLYPYYNWKVPIRTMR